nr:protein kinase-like domain, phloem protein 2-like protein [Tanacetum cinerariifolium]
MEAMMEQYKDLQIVPYDEITEASNTFHKDNYLGGGGFGNVYKGELSRFKERGMVAFKRLDRQYGQGETEFLKEVSMLSKYKHENLITLLGYCIKDKEMILVYEYAAHGSLDFHLGSRDFTWTQRLKICLQAAEGLRFLHDPNGAHHNVIHRDIKSGNILLDDKWNAKIADVGLSKISPENANLVTVVRGTPGYTDPQYHQTYTLTDKSDVYSFGEDYDVILSIPLPKVYKEIVRVAVSRVSYSSIEELKERLSEGVLINGGKATITIAKIILWVMVGVTVRRPVRLTVRFHYDDEDNSPVEEASPVKLKKPLKHATKTKKDDPKEGKEALKEWTVTEEIALCQGSDEVVQETQEFRPMGRDRAKTKKKAAGSSSGGSSLFVDLWASINEKEESCVLISIEECLIQDDPNTSCNDNFLLQKDSRFPVRCYKTDKMNFKLCIRTPLFLSPDVTYRLNLVFHCCDSERGKMKHVGIRRTPWEKSTSGSSANP